MLEEEVVVVGGSIRPPPETDEEEAVREEVGFVGGAPALRDDMDMSTSTDAIDGGRVEGWMGRRGSGRGGC